MTVLSRRQMLCLGALAPAMELAGCGGGGESDLPPIVSTLVSSSAGSLSTTLDVDGGRVYFIQQQRSRMTVSSISTQGTSPAVNVNIDQIDLWGTPLYRWDFRHSNGIVVLTERNNSVGTVPDVAVPLPEGRYFFLPSRWSGRGSASRAWIRNGQVHWCEAGGSQDQPVSDFWSMPLVSGDAMKIATHAGAVAYRLKIFGDWAYYAVAFRWDGNVVPGIYRRRVSGGEPELLLANPNTFAPEVDFWVEGGTLFHIARGGALISLDLDSRGISTQFEGMDPLDDYVPDGGPVPANLVVADARYVYWSSTYWSRQASEIRSVIWRYSRWNGALTEVARVASVQDLAMDGDGIYWTVSQRYQVDIMKSTR